MLRWKIGDVTVTRIVEMESASIGAYVLPQATAEIVDGIPWLRPHFLDSTGRLLLSIHALLIESQGERILVDTCVGNDKARRFPAFAKRQGSFLEDLEKVVSRNSVDQVLCTHLHVDHVGWNTMLDAGRWVATFPAARYLFGRREWEYWKEQQGADDRVVIDDSVRPIVDAGLADLVDTDHRLTDEVSLLSTPGHTPGHVSVRISSRGEEGLITGDLIHHPCQLVHPEWSASVDFDQQQSRATRGDFLAACADAPVLVIGTHFATPTAGRVVRDGNAYRLDF